ncbi:MAG: hypothetical protein C4521_03770 [Actinobacteria bacterium]|nr:MAG: hypothetical protein C4521_03770 [Actinomycetota bacterium]
MQGMLSTNEFVGKEAKIGRVSSVLPHAVYSKYCLHNTQSGICGAAFFFARNQDINGRRYNL